MPSNSDRRPLIVLAVPDETRALLKLARARWGSAAMGKAIQRGEQGKEVRVGPLRILTTGMGQRQAELSIRASIGAEPPAWVVTAGFTGGLNPALKLADLIWDADPNFPARSWLEHTGGVPGIFHCHPTIAATARSKEELRRATGADAVEMESGVIRSICSNLGIPSATLRVISDTADADMPLDFNRITTPDLRLDPVKLALEILKAPQKIPGLIRFQGEIARAAQTLAEQLMKAPI